LASYAANGNRRFGHIRLPSLDVFFDFIKPLDLCGVVVDSVLQVGNQLVKAFVSSGVGTEKTLFPGEKVGTQVDNAVILICGNGGVFGN